MKIITVLSFLRCDRNEQKLLHRKDFNLARKELP